MSTATITRKSTKNVVKNSANTASEAGSLSANVSNAQKACNKFAFKLGESGRMTLEQSAPLHKAYAKLAEDAQKEWRKTFIINYIAGELKVSVGIAETLFTKPRTERKPGVQLAVLRGAEKFRSHIARNGGSKNGGTPAAKVRVTTDVKTAIIECVEAVYDECNAFSVGEMIKYLQAFRKTLK